MSNSNQYSSNQQVYYPQNDFQQQNKLKVQQRKTRDDKEIIILTSTPITKHDVIKKL